ncbi:MAG: hypothetical protein GF317_15560 [Candidatus Lokiarchaeota archaeon]|nr:hypothetical protein [Candidatus Lokiarchaeota archaeon]MBD3200980.1 hypothetical protein [Candidatus Lokiarchaeota archaeon]
MGKRISLDAIIDLSMVEIITLNSMLEYGKPIVRYTLYVIVNEYIHSKKLNFQNEDINTLPYHEKKLYQYLQIKNNQDTDLSTSSFYNNLSNLEKKGFIKFNENSKGRVETVDITPLTRYVIKYLLQYFMDSAVIPDFVKFDEGLTQKIKDRSGKTHLENIMALWFSEYIQLRLINWFKKLANEVFILSQKKTYEDYSKTDLEDVHIAKIHKKMIREPNNFIEMVAIPNYKKKIHFNNMERIDVLKELYRIIKPGGMVVLVAKSPFPLTQDIAADELLSIYRESISNAIFTKEELINDLETAGFSNIEILNYRGMLVGLGNTE